MRTTQIEFAERIIERNRPLLALIEERAQSAVHGDALPTYDAPLREALFMCGMNVPEFERHVAAQKTKLDLKPVGPALVTT